MDIKNLIVKLPIIIFSAIVPLIVSAKSIIFTKEWFYAYKGVRSFVDFFSYYKMIVIIVSLILGLVFMLMFSKKDDYKKMLKPLINKLLIAMAVLIILSSILSKYQFIVYFGFMDRFEGMFVSLAYIFFVFYINNFVKEKKDLKIVLIPIVISSVIVAIIGILQSYCVNFFATDIGKMLIKGDLSTVNQLSINSSGLMESTLYNPNYIGSYSVIAFFLGIGLVAFAKNRFYKILLTLYTVIMLVFLLKSKSAAGLLALVIALITLFLYGLFNMSKKTALILVMGAIAFSIVAFPKFSHEYNRFWSSLDSSVPKYYDMDFKFKGNRAEFYKDDRVFKVMYIQNKFIFVLDDEEIYRKEIQINDLANQGKKDENIIISINNDFVKKNFEITYKENINSMVVKLKPRFIITLEATEEGLNLRDYVGRPLKYEEEIPSSEFFEGKDRWGSGRGYIWRRSIPLLKEHFILGSGPDTFPVVFPQHDLVGKRKFMYNAYTFVDKPHNMYIQMGANYGVLYLILYLMSLLVYSIKSIKLYFNKTNKSNLSTLGVMIFCSVFAYNVAGIFNDSVVHVAPLYWTIFGLGIWTNRYNEESAIVAGDNNEG